MHTDIFWGMGAAALYIITGVLAIKGTNKSTEMPF